MSGQENICSAFPWEMVPCQGNHVLMETPVVGQHKVRRGAREQRGRGRNGNVHLSVSLIIFAFQPQMSWLSLSHLFCLSLTFHAF